MIKPTSTTIIASIALLMFTWGCGQSSNPPTPGSQHIDKARDAVDALEQRHQKQEEQIDDLQE